MKSVSQQITSQLNTIGPLPNDAALYLPNQGWVEGGKTLETIRHGFGNPFQVLSLKCRRGRKNLVHISHGLSRLEKLQHKVNDPELREAMTAEHRNLRTRCKAALEAFSSSRYIGQMGRKFIEIMRSLTDAIVTRQDVNDREQAALAVSRTTCC